MLRISTEDKRVSHAEQVAASGSFAVPSIRCGTVYARWGYSPVTSRDDRVSLISVIVFGVLSLYTASDVLKVFSSAAEFTGLQILFNTEACFLVRRTNRSRAFGN